MPSAVSPGRILPVALLPLLVLGGAPQARAGGIGLYEMGTSDLGLASAGRAARAQDPSVIAANPAGLARLEGSQIVLGVQGLMGKVAYEAGPGASAGGDGGNALDFTPGGSLFASHAVNGRWTLGFGAYSDFGLGLDYDDDWSGRYLVQEASLVGLTFAPSVAYRVNGQISLGASLLAMYGALGNRTAIRNLDPALDDGRIELEDRTWGFSGRFGVLYEPTAQTRLGLAYRLPTKLDFSDTPSFSGLGPGVKGLLDARGLRGAEVDLDITVPQAITFSAYHEIDPQWAVMGGLGWEDWSEFGKVGVGIESDNPRSVTQNSEYDDSWHVALGVQYHPAEAWTLSSGLAYDSGILDNDQRTADLPLGATWRLGLGTQYAWSERLEIGVGYTLAWVGDLSIDQMRGPLSGRLDGEYEDTRIHFFGANMRWRF